MLKSDNRILYIDIDGTWVPFACLTSNSFDETVDMISTTTRASGSWKTSIPAEQSFTVSFEAFQIRTVDNTRISYDNLKALQRLRALQDFKVESTVDGTLDLFSGYFINIGEVAASGDLLTFSGQIEGYGEPVSENSDPVTYTPILTLVSQDSNSIDLQWTLPLAGENFNAQFYRIYRGDVPYASRFHPTDTYSDFGIVDGKVYSYNVAGVDVFGNESNLSNKVISGVVSKPGVEAFLFQDDEVFFFQDGATFEFQ